MKNLLSILLLFAIGCSGSEQSDTSINQSNSQHSDSSVEDNFDIYLNKFPELEFPIILRGCDNDYDYLEMLEIDESSLYVKSDCYAVGQVHTNGDYVAVITLGLADCLLPEITTYTLDGEKIDSKTIAIGYCGAGPCFECHEYMTLNEDLSFYTSDTITTTDCDDDYIAVEGTEKIKVIYMEGYVSENGIIDISDELVKEIK